MLGYISKVLPGKLDFSYIMQLSAEYTYYRTVEFFLKPVSVASVMASYQLVYQLVFITA